MAKARAKIAYVCDDCGVEHPKWQGQCSACGKWNTLRQFSLQRAATASGASAAGAGYSGDPPEVARLAEVETAALVRMHTGMEELDRVLGGGFVPGSVVLIGGDPGAGKSTLLLQVAAAIAQREPMLYVSGEESLQQIADRARRLDLPLDNLLVATETRVEAIAELAEKHRPRAIVVDSIQVMHTESTGQRARQRHPGPRVGGAADQAGETDPHHGDPGGSRHQGRQSRRTQGAGTHDRLFRHARQSGRDAFPARYAATRTDSAPSTNSASSR